MVKSLWNCRRAVAVNGFIYTLPDGVEVAEALGRGTGVVQQGGGRAGHATAPVRVLVQASPAGSAARRGPARPRSGMIVRSQFGEPDVADRAASTAGSQARRAAAWSPCARRRSPAWRSTACCGPGAARRARASTPETASRWPSSRHAVSLPDHQPATVGRSCVLVMDTAPRSQIAGRGVTRVSGARSNHNTRMPSMPASLILAWKPSGNVPRSSPSTIARCRYDSSRMSRSMSSTGKVQVDALRRAHPVRQHPEPREAHRMVDPDAARVAHRGAQHLDDRRRSRGACSPRGENAASPQLCPRAFNRSGGRADADRPIKTSGPRCAQHWLPPASTPTAKIGDQGRSAYPRLPRRRLAPSPRLRSAMNW